MNYNIVKKIDGYTQVVRFLESVAQERSIIVRDRIIEKYIFVSRIVGGNSTRYWRKLWTPWYNSCQRRITVKIKIAWRTWNTEPRVDWNHISGGYSLYQFFKINPSTLNPQIHLEIWESLPAEREPSLEDTNDRVLTEDRDIRRDQCWVHGKNGVAIKSNREINERFWKNVIINADIRSWVEMTKAALILCDQWKNDFYISVFI